jgi:hypothetical protein
MLNIGSLHAEVVARQSKRFAIYEEVFQRVISRIKYENTKTDSCSCMYKLPIWVFGVPLYNLGACASYIISRLQEHFFSVSFQPPNILFISWAQRPTQQMVSSGASGNMRAINMNPRTMSMLDIQEAKLTDANINPSKNKQSIFDEIDKTFLEKSSDIIKAPLSSAELNSRLMRPASYGLNIDDFRKPAPSLDDVLSALD